MSKELEALKRIKSHYNDRVCIDILEDFDLIETALKRLERYENEIQSISEMIAKELKAFNTIKEKKVDIHYLLKCKTPDEYNKKIRWLGFRDDLVQEEYDLLKEVLL